MKKTFILIIIATVFCTSVKAQSNVRYKNHNLIFNADIAAGNPYTIAASSVITGLANYYLLNDAFFENSFAYGIYTTNVEGLKARTLNPMGLTASNLFNNFQIGLKLGYQSYNPDFVNYGFYASAHYKIDQFNVGYDDDNMNKHRAQRALLGATALLSLGDMSQSSRVIIEAGLRYSLGISYKSPLGDNKSQLNDGIVSHFGIKLASRGMLQNIGLYADINHFNMWKDFRPNQELNNYTIGITWTITPQQVDER